MKKYYEWNKEQRKDYAKKYNKVHREEIRKYRVSHKYGLTLLEFNSLLSKQGYKCAICDKPLENRRDIHIDHDHKKGKVRGILCRSCNTGIGLLKDDPDIIYKAYNYIFSGD